MNRTTWLQDRRMQKFCDVLTRWERREISAQEAGEILGISERHVRRYRRRYEEDGVTELADRRLGKASAKRVPVRPSLTAAARDVTRPRQVGTKTRPSGRTKNLPLKKPEHVALAS